MGMRKPGELEAALRQAYIDLATPDEEFNTVVMDAPSAQLLVEVAREIAVDDLLARMFERALEADNDENTTAWWTSQLLDGLRVLGWSDGVPPEPKVTALTLQIRLEGLLKTPWSADNTYEQGVLDAIGMTHAVYEGKKWAPAWNRCKERLPGTTSEINRCVRQMPHDEHQEHGGKVWKS